MTHVGRTSTLSAKLEALDDPRNAPDGAFWLHLAANVRGKIDAIIGKDNRAEWLRIESQYDVNDTWMSIYNTLLAEYTKLLINQREL